MDLPSHRLSVASSKTSVEVGAELESGQTRSPQIMAPPVDEHALEAASTKVEALEEKPQIDPDIITFDGPDDPLNPMNWPAWFKAVQTVLLGLTTFVVTFASSVFSTGISEVAQEFNISTEVATLGTSLFVLGFAFGPVIWGPASELGGRKAPLLFAYFCFCIFQIPVAIGPNLYTIIICRFFGGLFASAPLGIVAGALADMYSPTARGIASAVFAGATFGGPAMGPIVGGFVTKSYLGWRWNAWITLFIGMTMFAIDMVVLSESYVPRLLQIKARKIRHSEKRWAVRSKLDETEFSFQDIAVRFLTRPLRMLFSEPMLLLLTIYSSFIYGILYLLFSAVPFEFQGKRGWSAGVADLPFLGEFIGIIIGCLILVGFAPRFSRKLAASGGKPIPEERLVPMMIGAVLFPIGAFLFAWTDVSHVSSWVPSVIALAFVGAGVLLIFLQTINYIVDSYLIVADSAIAANAFCRGLAGAGFPLFANALFGNLGVDWAASTIGFLALAMPIPFVFYVYGPRLRKMSKFAP